MTKCNEKPETHALTQREDLGLDRGRFLVCKECGAVWDLWDADWRKLK